MQEHLEDAAILAGLATVTFAWGYCLWIFLGPVGFSGAIAGYGVGASLFLAPLPED